MDALFGKIAEATLKYAGKDYDEAISLLKKVVRLAPSMSEPCIILGRIYKDKGKESKSLNYYMRAAHLSPEDPALWKYLLTVFIEQNNIGQAMYCLSKAISADPSDIPLSLFYALLQWFIGKSHHVAVEVIPKITEATLKYARKEYDEVISLLIEVRSLSPSIPETCSILGHIYKVKGEESQSLHCHLNAACVSYDDPALWKYLVTVSLEKKDISMARFGLRFAISADPSDIPLRLFDDLLLRDIGITCKKRRRIARKIADATLKYVRMEYDEVISLLIKVVSLAPKRSEPCNILGRIYKDKGEESKSLNYYMRAAHLSPEDRVLWKYLVTASLEQNNIGQARYCLSKAIRADPSDTKLRLHYAFLQAELVNYHSASAALDIVLSHLF